MAQQYTEPHSRDLRQGRRSIAGQIYLITAVTLERQNVFAQFQHARTAQRAFHDAAIRRRATTLAHVVMPDHVHWLAQLLDHANLSTTVQIYKAKVSHELGQRIWQKGFHDRALRSDDNVRAAARYIVANPLRAGLVTTIGEYPHWDAIWLQGNDASGESMP